MFSLGKILDLSPIKVKNKDFGTKARVAGSSENKANSAFNLVKVEVEAEFGQTRPRTSLKLCGHSEHLLFLFLFEHS